MPYRINGTPLVYFPVPKIACTSIKHALLNHNQPGLADRIAEDVARRTEKGTRLGVHGIYPSVPFRPAYRLRYGLGRWFCVVRDPVKRLLSAYANRVLYLDELKKVDPEMLRAAGLRRQPEPDEFVARLEDYRRLEPSIDHHVAPLCDFLGRVPERFDRVFDLSEMDALADYVAAAGAPMSFPRLQTGGPKLGPDMLSAASLEKLRALYAEDYRAWGRFLPG